MFLGVGEREKKKLIKLRGEKKEDRKEKRWQKEVAHCDVQPPVPLLV